MKNLAAKLSHEQYESNFAEIHPPFTENSATAEANRCLYCYDSPCMKACPTHIDISTFIKKIATGNLKGSAKTILKSNWAALTCAKACPVDVLCEGACVYNERGEEPIQIGRLQRYAMDRYFEHGMSPLFTPAPKNGKSIGVIGAGAAGLSCAAEAALLGFDVTVYDANEKPGGLNTWGIAPYKMTQEDALNEVKLVQSFGVKIQSGVRVGRDIQLAELEQKHDAIFLGVGLGFPSRLNISGENLPGVVDALDFIGKVTTRNWTSIDVGKRVAVIGAGNTAIDAVTEARRLGAEQVMIIYRRSQEEMPAYDFEYELAKSDGVQFQFLTAPSRIIGHSHVEALECIQMKLGERDEEGRRRPVPVPDSEFQIPVDMIIKSVGQNIEQAFLAQISNLKIESGKVWVNPDTLQTSNQKYFAGGDCINGGKEVVNAAADGKKAAHGIHSILFV
ncbi:MAG: NAD(P)-dependent oxidoreductase [Bacteroidetes bacterium]|nr:NAD(P)-dependent oxidoreductase [Bacteroidota bacterium]MCW5895498.1 NAD(P)-dependent oxidoreductase [Bacteroidota bacterium]